MQLEITLNDTVLLSYHSTSTVKFPTDRDRNEWIHSFGDKFDEKIKSLPDNDRSKLTRTLKVSYSSLDGDEIYNYESRQYYVDGYWYDLSSSSD